LTCRRGKELRSVSTTGLRPLVKTPLLFLPSPPPLKNSFLSGSPFGRQKIASLFLPLRWRRSSLSGSQELCRLMLGSFLA